MAGTSSSTRGFNASASPFSAAFLIAASTFAAELPPVPSEPIAVKKELLFSDDFERTDLGKAWGPVVPTFTLETGMLKGRKRA